MVDGLFLAVHLIRSTGDLDVARGLIAVNLDRMTDILKHMDLMADNLCPRSGKSLISSGI